MSLLRFPEKRYLKNAIYGTVTLLPIAVVLSASISSTKTLRHDAGCLAVRLLSSGPAMPSSDSRQKCG
jgi:hypothetical protein